MESHSPDRAIGNGDSGIVDATHVQTASDLKCEFTSVIGHRTSAAITTFLSCLMLILMLPLDVCASDTAGGGSPPVAGGAMFWIFVIVFFSRKKAIGGWLLYYFICLYFGALITLSFFLADLSSYIPQEWDSLLHYLIFLVTSLPVLIMLFTQVVLSVVLISKAKRDWKYILMLRKLLLASLLLSLVNIPIDVAFWESTVNAYFNGYYASVCLLWFLYFSKSRRVQLVFQEKAWSWNVLRGKPHLISPSEINANRKGPKSWHCAKGHVNDLEKEHCNVCNLRRPVGWRCVYPKIDNAGHSCNHVNALEASYCSQCGASRPKETGIQ